MTDVTPIANIDDVPEGGMLPVTVSGVLLLLYRDGADVFATQRNCLHQGGDLAEGTVVDGMVVCPVHGWKFSIRTGQHELSPETCLRTFPVEVRDGTVYLEVTW